MARKGKGMSEPRDIEQSHDTKVGASKEGNSYYGKGHGKYANMPTEVEMDAYPNPYESLDNDAYADTIEGIDENQRFNNKQVRSHRSRSMY